MQAEPSTPVEPALSRTGTPYFAATQPVEETTVFYIGLAANATFGTVVDADNYDYEVECDGGRFIISPLVCLLWFPLPSRLALGQAMQRNGDVMHAEERRTRHRLVSSLYALSSLSLYTSVTCILRLCSGSSLSSLSYAIRRNPRYGSRVRDTATAAAVRAGFSRRHQCHVCHGTDRMAVATRTHPIFRRHFE
jgi:hypothetical protein